MYSPNFVYEYGRNNKYVSILSHPARNRTNRHINFYRTICPVGEKIAINAPGSSNVRSQPFAEYAISFAPSGSAKSSSMSPSSTTVRAFSVTVRRRSRCARRKGRRLCDRPCNGRHRLRDGSARGCCTSGRARHSRPAAPFSSPSARRCADASSLAAASRR